MAQYLIFAKKCKYLNYVHFDRDIASHRWEDPERDPWKQCVALPKNAFDCGLRKNVPVRFIDIDWALGSHVHFSCIMKLLIDPSVIPLEKATKITKSPFFFATM